MAVGFTITFDGIDKDQYEAVMGKANLDLRSPGNPNAADKWPDGIISHVAGASPTGWCVVDVWESQGAFDQFFADRLGPALQNAGLPQPNVTSFEVYNSHTQ